MTVPPPTPKRALNAPAAVATTARRAIRGDMVAILGSVSASAVESLQRTLGPFVENPSGAAIVCDVDGTLAPIVRRAEDAHVPPATARLLASLARRYACVACVSGRPAAEARRLVGVGGITYVGLHGADRIASGATSSVVAPEVAAWEGPVRSFSEGARDGTRLLGIRIEDKGPIVAFHWRSAPDQRAAKARLEVVAADAEEAGLVAHWGRRVLEVRPPVEVSKGAALRGLVEGPTISAALFAGDDATDLDGFDALDAELAQNGLTTAVKVGIRSEEGPSEIVERADLVVDEAAGFVAVLEHLAATDD